MKLSVVMTCNADIWAKYGRRAVSAFLEFWPADAQLMLYAEDFAPDLADARLVVLDMPQWFTTWKERHRNNLDAHGRAGPRRPYDFRRDCVRFSHKVAALTAGVTRSSGGLLIMMDADVITHAPVTADWLARMITPADYLAWLDRPGWYPECGFVIFNAEHPYHQMFMSDFRAIYETDRVFKMMQTHDSHVLQQHVNVAVATHQIQRPVNLSGQLGQWSGHPWVHSVLAERLDHLKGKRKLAGKTPAAEVPRSRTEKYWKEP